MKSSRLRIVGERRAAAGNGVRPHGRGRPRSGSDDPNCTLYKQFRRREKEIPRARPLILQSNIARRAAHADHRDSAHLEPCAMPIDWDELAPRKPAAKPRDLDTMSVEELADYIATLEEEIGRVRAKIRAKEAHRSGAAGLFKKG
jgi:uncharacterized small protein (DUF1192 family)